MSIAQSNFTDGGASTLSATFSSAQTAGNCNIAFVLSTDTTVVTSLTDTKGNAYTLAVGPVHNTNSNTYIYAYVAPGIVAATAGANAVTVNTSAGTVYEILIVEYGAITAPSPVDVSNSATGIDTTPTASVTTTNASDTIITYAAASSSGVPTIASPFTKQVAPGYNTGEADYIVTSTGTYTPVWTSDNPWLIIVLALKASAAGYNYRGTWNDAISTWNDSSTTWNDPGTVSIAPTGIAATNAFGTATVLATATIAPTGIASTNAFGTATVSPGALSIAPLGIASTNAFGTTSVSSVENIAPSGIASTNAFGTAVIATGAVIAPTGIASTNAFGTAVLSATYSLSPAGIASTNAFGTAAVSPGVVNIAPSGIASTNVFGTAVLSVGVVNIAPAGIASTNVFGIATVSISAGVANIAPSGIASTNAFGLATLSTGVSNIAPTGIASTNVFGIATVSSSSNIAPAGIPSTNAFGTTVITRGVAPFPGQLSTSLVQQTGMPPVYQNRSRELIYDALQNDFRFIFNPFGPQLLPLSRPNHRWTGTTAFTPRTTPPPGQLTTSLVPQTGMPPIYQNRSRELIYDALQNDIKFAKNPFGPQLLVLSRPDHRWNGTSVITRDSVPVQSQLATSLVPQTGMPSIYQNRSRELIYDALQEQIKFVKNPFGPQLLVTSRPNHRWN